MTNSIDAAVTAATQNAQQTAQTLPSTVPTASVPVHHMPTAAATPASADAFMNHGGISVDTWAKVKDTGIVIEDCKGIESILVRLDMNAVQYFYAAKAGVGDTTKYIKSADQVMTVEGLPWQDELMVLKQMEPKCRPYPTADIPVELLEDVKTGKSKVEAGTTVGVGLSTTNYSAWNAFYKKMVAAGKELDEITVRIGFQERAKGTYTWGLFTFDFVEDK